MKTHIESSSHRDSESGMESTLGNDDGDNASSIASGSYGRGADSSYTGSRLTNGTSRTAASDKEILMAQLSRQLFCLKLLVVLLLVLAALGVALAVYYSTHNAEVSSYEDNFGNSAEQIFSNFALNMERKLAAVDFLSVSLTSTALSVNAPWPFFTIPDFENRAAVTREQAKAAAITLLPLVYEADRPVWESYSVNNTEWIRNAQDFEAQIQRRDLAVQQEVTYKNGIAAQIYELDENGREVVDRSLAPFLPMWEHSPVAQDAVNYNLRSNPNFRIGIDNAIESFDAVIGTIWDVEDRSKVVEDLLSSWFDESEALKVDPLSKIFYPVFNSYEQDHDVVAILAVVVDWITYFDDALPPENNGIVCVLSNVCSESETFEIEGEHARYIGRGDHHDTGFDHLGQTMTFDDLFAGDGERITRASHVGLNHDYCPFKLSVYPSTTFRDDYVSNNAVIYSVCIALVFLFAIAMFLCYDWMVSRRQKVVETRALQSRAIVTSLFPAAVRDRMFSAQDSLSRKNSNDPKASLKAAMKTDEAIPHEQQPRESKPIADLFPHSTVLFADIAGFTAWSAKRQPQEVFTLLQTVYHAFDRIAKRRGVFKVETIGDCYVAVTGLPDPQPDHAVRMAKFANECLKKMPLLLQSVKDSLGEDTMELAMRFGLHSGPVTAGVLRGEKSRFQLFGNTVNTAAHMESTGRKNKIHCSQETADLIAEAGHIVWLHQNVDDIADRGGFQTFFIEPSASDKDGADEAKSATKGKENAPEGRRKVQKMDRRTELDDKEKHLVEWNVDLFKKMIKQIIAHRQAMGKETKDKSHNLAAALKEGPDIRDEVVASIDFPVFNKEESNGLCNPSSVKLSKDVESQLRDFISFVASMYRDNAFHNFTRSSNFCVNINKLLQRVVDETVTSQVDEPLTRFGILFASLVHAIDHTGVPNSQLIKEKSRIAVLYKRRSVAQQNAIDLAFSALMDSDYVDLQAAIFTDEEDVARFRKIVVNCVIATDLEDEDLIMDRKIRWEQAFQQPLPEDATEEMCIDNRNLRATVMVESIMQASYFGHTLQYFLSYKLWNERLFREMYQAYKNGRLSYDPSKDWFEAELKFLDEIVVPTARRIKESKVLGIAGDDLDGYAVANRKEWHGKGEEISGEFVERWNMQTKK